MSVSVGLEWRRVVCVILVDVEWNSMKWRIRCGGVGIKIDPTPTTPNKHIHLKTGAPPSVSIAFPPSFQKQAQTKRWKSASSDPASVWR